MLIGTAFAKMNKRHEIMRECNGILGCRAGRLIDCIQPGWTKFQNYDLNIKVEIDFDAELESRDDAETFTRPSGTAGPSGV